MTILDGTYSAFLVPITIAFSADLNKWCWNTIVDMIAGKPDMRMESYINKHTEQVCLSAWVCCIQINLTVSLKHDIVRSSI